MESLADSFIEAVVEGQKKYDWVIHGLKTDMYPMVSLIQLEKTEAKVEQAKQEGARRRSKNRPIDFNKGTFSNQLFLIKLSEMTMMNVETFGPIIPIQKKRH